MHKKITAKNQSPILYQKIQTTVEIGKDKANTKDAKLDNARLDNARLGDVRLGDVRLGDARPDSARLGYARLGDARPNGARLGNARLGDARPVGARPSEPIHKNRTNHIGELRKGWSVAHETSSTI